MPRVGGLDGLNAFTKRLIAMTKAVLDLHKDRLLPEDTGMAAFLVVTAVQSAAQRARLTHPEHYKSEAFAAELGALVSRYLFPRALSRIKSTAWGSSSQPATRGTRRKNSRRGTPTIVNRG